MSNHGMKSAEEWAQEVTPLRSDLTLKEQIRVIQLNALEAAARVANECKANKAWKGAIGYHVYVRGCNNVQLAIISLAETIKGGK